ncbi:MAG: phosphate ABC transporter permease PstA [Pseudomonadota bacterium]
MATTTVDMTALSAQHTSEAANKRSRARHWAQWRLKAYGIAAIMLAALALGILISTVIVRATTVFYEYYISLDTMIEVAEGDRARLADPNPRVRVGLDKVTRTALLAKVERDLSRNERRDLGRLLSTDAGLELGDAVKADMGLIGQRYLYPALLDDEVQMYLKGAIGRLQDAGTAGPLELTEEGDEIRLSFEPGAMATAREVLAEQRGIKARAARAEVARQENAIAATRASLAAAAQAQAEEDEEGAETASLQSALDAFIARRDRARELAEALQAKSADPAAVFDLTGDDPSVLIRTSGGWLKLSELGPEDAKAAVMEPLSTFGEAEPGAWEAFYLARPEVSRNLNDRQIVWVETFKRMGFVFSSLNTRLLSSSDSSNAELAGIWGAMVGSFWTMIVTFCLAFPIGVMAAIYLEEFAPKNRLTDFIEVNINNLAAVSSIVFGLFGITVLITGVKLFDVQLFDGLLRAIIDDPRSTPLAGGFVLALMSLPTIIIAARASIRAVPPSIRDAALGIGASKLQTSTHHVLPLAMPGILTGSIIAMAQALGETAPLIIIGMNSFIQEAPSTPFDKGNVLPSLIYLWNNNSERLFDGKTAAAIVVLLIFLIAMNALAVLLRKRFERRW